MRFRRSGTRNTLASFSSIEQKPQLPVASYQLPVTSYALQNVNLAAGLFNLFLGRLGKLMRVHGERLLQLALAKYFDQRILRSHDADLAQYFRSDFRLVQRGQPVEVHHFIFRLEDVGETALRQTPVQRHLAAFKSTHQAGAAPRSLALVATRRGLTHA